MNVTIHVFAHLKEFFEAQFQIALAEGASVGDAVETLARMRPAAAGVLRASRAAVAESFVSPDFVLGGDAELFLLPPSSGG